MTQINSPKIEAEPKGRPMKYHPEFDRAMHAIEEAVHATEIEGQDMRSLATSFLVHAAHFYRHTHGTDGPDGLLAVLDKLAADGDQRGQSGPSGRA